MQTQSLSFRLLISTGVVLLTFFVLAGVVFEQSFTRSTERGLNQTLRAHLYSLLAVAKMSDDGRMKMPKSMREPRFASSNSGLYAAITQTDSTIVWRSLSSTGVDLAPPLSLKPGRFIFIKNGNYRALHYSIIWENQKAIENYYIFTVAENEDFIISQIDKFRTTLLTWLFFIAIFLVLAQYFVLHWSLKPLRAIVVDLAKIESGEKTKLNGEYPIELKGLANNLNTLINNDRLHLQRYRNSLSDLAHSLKTPLTILRGFLATINDNNANEQISRMDDIIEYQLQSAAAKGNKKLISKIDINPILDKIIISLNKVYFKKKINFQFIHDNNCLVYCETGDIYEIAGNLLDNAAKWCKNQVQIKVIDIANQDDKFSWLLEIADDGDGIAVQKLDEILQRGGRADENTKGYGIGMTVVSELITLLDGKLVASKSETLGGMKWQVYLL